MSNTKKIAIMSTLVLLLAVTAVFNFVLAGTGGSKEVNAGVSADADYFTTFRAERTSKRNEEFLQLDSVIAAYEAGTEEHTQAVQEKQKMVEIMEDELVMESIVKTLGFSDAAVIISNDTGRVNVFVSYGELTAELQEKIFYTFEVEHKIRNGKISIMPVFAES